MEKYRKIMALIIIGVYSIGMTSAALVNRCLYLTFDYWFCCSYMMIGVFYSTYIGFKKGKSEENDGWKDIVQWTSLLSSILVPLVYILESLWIKKESLRSNALDP